MEQFCPACGTQRADGAGFCGQCGHGFDVAASEATPAATPVLPAAIASQAPPPPQPQPAPSAAPPGAPPPPRRTYTLGQKLGLGLFLIGFLLVSFVIIEAKNRARHPQWHYRS